MNVVKIIIAIVLIITVLLFMFQLRIIKLIAKAFRELSKAKNENKKRE